MTLLSNGLETIDYNQPAWHYIGNKNMELLNAVLLKIKALGDVDADSPPNNSILVWSTASSTYKARNF